ncbi:hypothetical protein [Kitasatospora sp. NPDC059571]|uniref:hypothetical protein n=1 Tax=Kitasatospora sp. NPDC059571 TaxID=3346871 RepID=UPI00369E0C13
MSAPDNAPPAVPEPAPAPAALEPPAPAAADPVGTAVPTEATDPVQATETTESIAPARVRRMPRAMTVALAATGLLAVTAASAAVTVAVGRPDRTAPVAAAAPSAAASPSASPSASAPASASPAASSAAPAPTPSSTVHGTVSGGTHGGDIRYFLLPLPAGAESYGSADGTSLSTKEVSEQFSNSDEMPDILKSYGYRNDAAERRYRTADGSQEVYVRILRFSGRSMAKEFADGLKFKSGDSFDIDGDGNAQGVMIKPEQEAWTGEMIGVSFSGDIEYEVKVYVKGTPDKALLVDAMKRQRERLATGG